MCQQPGKKKSVLAANKVLTGTLITPHVKSFFTKFATRINAVILQYNIACAQMKYGRVILKILTPNTKHFST